MSERCLSDDVLLALASGERSAARTRARAHAASCERCAEALRGFEQARAALLAEEPGPFATARMARELERAIDGDVRAQRYAWRGPRVAAAVVVAAMSGAALATVASGRFSSPPPSPPPSPAEAPAPPVAQAAPAAVAPAPFDEPGPEEPAPEAAPATAPEPESEPVRVARKPQPSPLEQAEQALAALPADAPEEDLLAAAELLQDAGAPDRAADVYVQALAGGGQAASLRLSRLVRRGAVAPEDAVERLRASTSLEDSAEGMRLRCEWGLKYRGDRRAVDDCRAFGRAWPTHPAVRILALAAGKAAESRLQDLELAVEEYSRALLVSEYAGVSGTHALLARARARAKLGERDEAEADLRLYLHVAPESWNREEIQELAAELGVEREP